MAFLSHHVGESWIFHRQRCIMHYRRHQAESWKICLYCKNKPTYITNLGELHWHLFTKYQFDSSKLPPTKKTLRQMVLRAHYTPLQWKSPHIPSPQLPNPNEFGWNWNKDDHIFGPVMTTNPPAPESIIELSSCRCKSGCRSGRCRCYKK